MNIYISNLSQQAMAHDLKKLFSSFGSVKNANIVTDNYTRRSRGCAFVEMEDRTSGQKAITGLHNTSFMQKILIVKEADDRQIIR